MPLGKFVASSNGNARGSQSMAHGLKKGFNQSFKFH